MKSEDKKEIVKILQQWGEMIGNDSQKSRYLISQMNQVSASEPISESYKNEIIRTIQSLADGIGYDPDVSNNKVRDRVRTTERFVISYIAHGIYAKSAALDIALSEFFGKHRTTFIHWRRRCDELIETKDSLFMEILGRAKSKAA